MLIVAAALFLLAPVSAAQNPAMATLIKTLSVPSVIDRVMAVETLLSMGPTAAPAIPALLDVLKTDDGLEELTTIYTPERVFAFNPVQNMTVRLLVNLGMLAVQPVEVALKTADPKGPQFSYLAEILVKMQRPETAAVVDGLLNDSRPLARQQAANVLGYSKDPGSVDLLISALGDTDPGVRTAAAASLAEITGQAFGEDAARWTAWRHAR